MTQLAIAMAGGLPLDADLMLAEPPVPPFDWVREGTSYWVFDDAGGFAIPRVGIEAEPHSWDNRRYQANFALADGRVLQAMGRGAMRPIANARGLPAVMGAGPVTFECCEPFERWSVRYAGEVIDTDLDAMLNSAVDSSRTTHLAYEFEARMAVPADVQDISPARFFTWGKGKQRDAASVGLGWRFQQLMTIEGEYTLDGKRHPFTATGNRVKRRSVRTDGLFLRGHCWMSAVFPDGRAFGFEVRPVHDDGHEPWNEAFVYQDGRMHHGKVVRIPWLDAIIARDEDVAVEIETDLGTTRIAGRTQISTFRLASDVLWGLSLHQGSVRYEWDGQVAYGMIERSKVEKGFGARAGGQGHL